MGQGEGFCWGGVFGWGVFCCGGGGKDGFVFVQCVISGSGSIIGNTCVASKQALPYVTILHTRIQRVPRDNMCN